jgi:hypothetical protein
MRHLTLIAAGDLASQCPALETISDIETLGFHVATKWVGIKWHRRRKEESANCILNQNDVFSIRPPVSRIKTSLFKTQRGLVTRNSTYGRYIRRECNAGCYLNSVHKSSPFDDTRI